MKERRLLKRDDKLTDDEIVGLEMAAACGDYGSDGDEIQCALDELRSLRVQRDLDQMYIAELRRRCGIAPHDGGPEPVRPGIEDIE